MSFLAVPQRAASYRAPSLPSSLAASCILWRMWRKTERWCSAARPREAHLPCTGECVTAVLYLSLPPLPVDAACFYTSDSLNIFQFFDIMSRTNVSILSSAVPVAFWQLKMPLREDCGKTRVPTNPAAHLHFCTEQSPDSLR